MRKLYSYIYSEVCVSEKNATNVNYPRKKILRITTTWVHFHQENNLPMLPEKSSQQFIILFLYILLTLPNIVGMSLVIFDGQVAVPIPVTDNTKRIPLI